MHNILFESRRVARRYVGVVDWLVSYAVCDRGDWARARDSVKRDLRVSLNNKGFSFLLSFCVVYAVHGVFYTLTEQILFCRFESYT